MDIDIHPTAIVSDKASIGTGAKIGPWTIIYDNVILGENVTIGANCEIGVSTEFANGKALKIGSNSNIRSGSVFYEGSDFGDGLVTGHKVTVRERTIAGKNLQIGTLSDIQGHVTIGDYVRTHSNVHIGQGTTIGNFVWVFPYVVFTNDPHPPSETHIGCTIGDYAAIATMSVILPGVNVGEHVLVAAHSCVTKDVQAHTVVGGAPAKFLCETQKIKLRGNANVSAYPWPKHFHRGYPREIIDQWKAEFTSTSDYK